jgi:ribosomal protein S18 acetylase RimI-like enzyme
MNFRDFRAEDLDAVLRLNVQAQNPEADEAEVRRLWHQFPDLHEISSAFACGAFVVSETDGGLVAMGGIKPAGEERFEVLHIRIAASHHRRGYGSQLMAELERRGRLLGAREFFLNTTVEQVAAQRLYESLGYVLTRRSVLRQGEQSYNLVHYSKRL